ncbi:MAG: hypothetical protein CM15mV24_1470 [Bellamyvirus sp.]|nr:MAG: hypothetical protein CM15mV24_1470 [Bellamyvirus sp.]
MRNAKNPHFEEVDQRNPKDWKITSYGYRKPTL